MASRILLPFRKIVRVTARGTAAECNIIAEIDQPIPAVAGRIADTGGHATGISHPEIEQVIGKADRATGQFASTRGARADGR